MNNFESAELRLGICNDCKLESTNDLWDWNLKILDVDSDSDFDD